MGDFNRKSSIKNRKSTRHGPLDGGPKGAPETRPGELAIAKRVTLNKNVRDYERPYGAGHRPASSEVPGGA